MNDLTKSSCVRKPVTRQDFSTSESWLDYLFPAALQLPAWIMTGEPQILTWFSDGKPLAPVTRPHARKQPNPYGPNAKKLKDDLANRKRRRERWLDKVHGVELPENHVNNKREYYRTEYLKSEHWKRLKARKLAGNNFCESCGTTRFLDVHHKRYKNLYDVGVLDLLTLCRSCHSELHEWMESNKGKQWDRLTKQTGLPPHMRPSPSQECSITPDFT